MFEGLEEEIKALNSDIKSVTNCDKAKKLRKKLLLIGIITSVVGFVGVFTCFILFATAGTAAFSTTGFTPNVLIPFFLFVPFGALASVGSTITKYGLKIVVTGYATNLIDETVGNNCPKCGDKISEEEMFCNKCGTAVKIECPKCNHINSIKNDYCEKCGNKLK